MLLASLSMPAWRKPAWQLTWVLSAGCLIFALIGRNKRDLAVQTRLTLASGYCMGM